MKHNATGSSIPFPGNDGRARMSIEVNNESGIQVDEARLVALSRFIFEQLYIHPQAELSILLVDEPAMEKLHIELMDEPGATDVLSVPMDELTPGTPDKPTPQGMLGDIAICPQVAEVQARNAGHSTAGRDAAADHARNPAPAGLRPRRTRGEGRDVRPAARAADGFTGKEAPSETTQ